jgi:hypothetical protein
MFHREEIETVTDLPALDRALTIGGVGRTLTGELSEVSKGIYAYQYKQARSWKLAYLRSSVGTFTPEQVAQYALWLVEQGYARATAGLAVRAIRWGHRVAGEPVPDGLPASYVLRSRDSTGSDHDAVNDTENAASRDPYEILAGFVSVCKPREAAGQRNLALIHAAYSGGFSADQLCGLNVEDLRIEKHPEWVGRRRLWVPYLTIAVGGVAERGDDAAEQRPPGLHIEHTPDRHQATMCPACSLSSWMRTLREDGAASGALFRSIDKGGNIAGTPRRKGGTSSTGGRLTRQSISKLVLRSLAAEAGLVTMLPNPLAALRLAGAVAAYVAGEIDAETAALRAGRAPGSKFILSELIRATAPTPRED